MRILWDEYRDFQPVRWCECNNCRCDNAKRWRNYQEQEYAMQFLVGLNPSFAQIRCHILSGSPLPSISRMFAMVMQEECQRTIEAKYTPNLVSNSSEHPGSMVHTTNYGKGRGKHDRFMCTKCGKTNHTMDRCFEIVGYPPGFGRGRGKPTSSSGKTSSQSGSRNTESFKSANQVQETISDVAVDQSSSAMHVLSPDIISQLLSLLQSQMHNVTSSFNSSPSHSSSSSNTHAFSGSFTGNSNWEG